mmetsp:Transcript_7446/g.15592  ORF Transcript_7446/g.15592 Transcript_7446/m.15592 type:complete len:308 (-) Transcript_7446:1687-2610(-)
MHVSLRNLVVTGTKVRRRSHKLHVLVNVLVELHWIKLKASQRGRGRQLSYDLVALRVHVHQLLIRRAAAATTRRLRIRLLLLLLRRLDLDPVLRSEAWHDHVRQKREEVGVVPRALDPVVTRAQVGARLDVREVQRVGRVEHERDRRALGARPERLARGGDLVLREVVKQLTDFIVIVDLKVKASPRDAVVEREGAIIHQCGLDILEGVQLGALLLPKCFSEVRRGEVGVGVLHGLLEHALEHITRPLQRVLDLVREVLEGADRDRLLRRVARGAVVLSEVRHDHLCVTLGAEGARLKQGLLVEEAP